MLLSLQHLHRRAAMHIEYLRLWKRSRFCCNLPQS